MITTKTVLVLGAGASQPYGFPVGSELVKRVCTFAGDPDTQDWCTGFIEYLSKNVPGEVPSWNRLHHRMMDLQSALQILRPGLISIDAFLESRSDLAEVGKLAITVVLLRAESDVRPNLWSETTDRHWYDFLKSRMFGPLEEFAHNQIRVVTFNYERSLEYYLFTSLRPCYDPTVSDETYYRIMSEIPILHVYGSLGPLPWLSMAGMVGYGARGFSEALLASKNIKILHEGERKEIQENLEKAKNWLQWADRILFLGFGFQEDNVKRLALANTLTEKQKISGTCYRLNYTDRNKVEYCATWARRPEQWKNPKRAIDFPDEDADCYEFLHKHADLS